MTTPDLSDATVVPDGEGGLDLTITEHFARSMSLEDALNPRLRVAHLSARRFRLRPLVGRGSEAV